MRTKLRLRVSRRAQSQLTEITRFTRAAFGPTQAKKLSSDFKQLFHQLATFPLSRKLDPERTTVRRVVLQPFVILYEIAEEEVSIVAILHGARDPGHDQN